ncbi:MAG: C40 family peptidase [Cryomorphaceae bacterium]|nr:C40 family peptidase [Cryomorphaceae bacterium]
MVTRVLIILGAVGLLASCGGVKPTTSTYPEFVWEESSSPVVRTPAKKEKKEDPEPIKTEEADLSTVIDTWIGTPYQWGGTTREGADCSGFTLRLYEEVFGIRLQGRRVEDFFQLVEIVKLGNAQPGDLVFFRIKGNRVDHVGIYLGDNRFAHASSSRGVIISSLEEAYYQKYFFKVGRPKALSGS